MRTLIVALFSNNCCILFGIQFVKLWNLKHTFRLPLIRRIYFILYHSVLKNVFCSWLARSQFAMNAPVFLKVSAK